VEKTIETFEASEEQKPYNIRHRGFYFPKEIVLFVKGCMYGRIYHSLFDQLIRSAASIGANAVERKAVISKRDWKYLSQLMKPGIGFICSGDTPGADKTKITELIKEAEEISNIIAAIIINSVKQ
jgi:hypothetical protein